MEERRDSTSPDPSEDDSMSPSLPSPSLPSLQVVHQPHRTTNFFIDNILRPEFGCKKDHGPGRRERTLVTERRAQAPPLPDRPRLSSPPCPDSHYCNDSNSSSASSTVSSASVQKEPGADRPNHSGGATQSARGSLKSKDSKPLLWPAWVYCTRYSDRPSSGPRTRKLKKKQAQSEDKRPRTAFTAEQLQRLKTEFQANRYITEQRRQALANELNLNESQIKIWFQNKRAKIKKASGYKNTLALHLMAQGLYNHSTTTTIQKEDSD